MQQFVGHDNYTKHLGVRVSDDIYDQPLRPDPAASLVFYDSTGAPVAPE